VSASQHVSAEIFTSSAGHTFLQTNKTLQSSVVAQQTYTYCIKLLPDIDVTVFVRCMLDAIFNKTLQTEN